MTCGPIKKENQNESQVGSRVITGMTRTGPALGASYRNRRQCSRVNRPTHTSRWRTVV